MKTLIAAMAVLAMASRAAAGTVTGVAVAPASVATGATVMVTVSGTNPCGAAHIIYGDGTAITYPITGLPTSHPHVYDNPGTYAITAKGMGNCDGEATTRITVTGSPKPQPPQAAQITAVEISPQPPKSREPVTIAVKGSGTCAFEVQFGDGNIQDVNGPLPQQVRHVYPAAQTYTLIVRPIPPCTGRFTEQLQVVDTGVQPRIVRVTVAPAPANAGQEVTITVEGTGRCSYTLDFGDGNAESRTADLPDRVRHVYPAGVYSVGALPDRPCAATVRTRLEVRGTTSTAGLSGIEAAPNPVMAGQQTIVQIKGAGTCGMTIDFGDGNRQDVSGALPRRIAHTYPAPGRYTVDVVTEPPCTAGMRATIDVLRRH